MQYLEQLADISQRLDVEGYLRRESPVFESHPARRLGTVRPNREAVSKSTLKVAAVVVGVRPFAAVSLSTKSRIYLGSGSSLGPGGHRSALGLQFHLKTRHLDPPSFSLRFNALSQK
jgi:hypothetical protein